MSEREALEYFVVARLMSIEAREGYAAYLQCRDFLSLDMFANKQLRWTYRIICDMYEEGWECASQLDIMEYLMQSGKAPNEKIGSICCFLIEVYIQFANMTRVVGGVKWTIAEAVDKLVASYDMETVSMIDGEVEDITRNYIS